MKLSELIAAFRVRADDAVQPYLWDDTEVTAFLNEADKEAAERALLIEDATTANDSNSLPLCSLALVAGTARYVVSPLILKVERATLASTGDTLVMTSRERLDEVWDSWETATGTPQYLIDSIEGELTVVPKPTANDTVALIVKRLPVSDMAADNDTPEIPARHHYRMLDWALRLAYLKPDADANDPNASAQHEAMFERSFGVRRDANVQRKVRDRKPKTIKSGW